MDLEKVELKGEIMNDNERFREVSGIVYELKQSYEGTQEGKNQSLREGYFNRLHGFFSRTMRIKSNGRWGCYVSLVKKGE